MSQMLAFRVEGYALGVLKWYAPSTETPCSRGASSTPHQQPESREIPAKYIWALLGGGSPLPDVDLTNLGVSLQDQVRGR